MSFVLINHAPDGTHNHVYKTVAAAERALVAFLGHPVEFALGRDYYSDWGNHLVVEERAAGHTARSEAALRSAFDARECGTATKRQLALLDRKGF